MVFDFPTLVAIIVFTSALVGCLLLLSWLQHRRIFALVLWGSAFIIAAIATVLVVIVRNTVPDLWSIVIGNAILATAYGLIWSGARNFDGKRISIVLTLAGVLIWLAACSIGPIYARPEARATVMAVIAITYALHLRAAHRRRTLARARARRGLMALADNVAPPRTRSRHSGPYSTCRPAGRSLSRPSGIADLCSFRGIVPVHLCGIFIHKPREGSNCSPPPERFADRRADRRCEPSWSSPGGRATDDPSPS